MQCLFKNINAFSPSVADLDSTPALSLAASTANSKWVAFGGSYPGNLATWLKLKYPALVEGVVGSSAPVFAEYDFYQYAQVTGSALAYETIGGSSECYDTVLEGTTALMKLVKSTAPWGTSSDIPEALKPCNAMSNMLDISMYEVGEHEGHRPSTACPFLPTPHDMTYILVWLAMT